MIKYDHYSLVVRLYTEATKCLSNECYFAAIAMAWAAVDHAIDFELRGGTFIHPKTGERRESIRFRPADISGKLEKLFLLYPGMKKSEGNLVFLYKVLRNPFIHIRVGDVSLHPTGIITDPSGARPNGKKASRRPFREVNEYLVQVKDVPKLTLGYSAYFDFTGKNEAPDVNQKAALIEFAVPEAAAKAIEIARLILDQLAEAAEEYNSRFC